MGTDRVGRASSGRLILAFLITVFAMYTPHVLALWIDDHLSGTCSDCRSNWIRWLVVLPGLLPVTLLRPLLMESIDADRLEFVQATLAGFLCAAWITVGTLAGGRSRWACSTTGLISAALGSASAFVLTRLWAA